MDEERAIPEAIIIKREILKSYYIACEFLAEYIRILQIKGVKSSKNISQFKKYVTELYLKTGVNMLQETKIKKDQEMLNFMEEYIFTGKRFSDEKWIKLFRVMQRWLLKSGIYKLGLKVTDPNKAWMEM